MLLEPSDVAQALGLSASSVRRLEESGAIAVAARTPRGLRLFDQREVERARALLAEAAREGRKRIRRG